MIDFNCLGLRCNRKVVLNTPGGDVAFERHMLRRMLRAGLILSVRQELDEKIPLVEGLGKREVMIEPGMRFVGGDYTRVIMDSLWGDAGHRWRDVTGLMLDGEDLDGRPCLFYMMRRIRVGFFQWLWEPGRHYLLCPPCQVDTLDIRILMDYFEARRPSVIYSCRKEPTGLYVDDPPVFDDLLRKGMYLIVLSFLEVFGDADGVLELPCSVPLHGERTAVRLARYDDPGRCDLSFGVSLEHPDESLAYDVAGRTLPVDDLLAIVEFLDGYYVKSGTGCFWGEI